MRRTLVFLAACGGGGDGGAVDADINGMAFSEACKLTESDTYMDLAATNGDGLGLEFKWNKSLINATGTYMTGGIVADLSLFVLQNGEISNATGKLTFTLYAAPSQVMGTFELAVAAKSLTATGAFDCR